MPPKKVIIIKKKKLVKKYPKKEVEPPKVKEPPKTKRLVKKYPDKPKAEPKKKIKFVIKNPKIKASEDSNKAVGANKAQDKMVSSFMNMDIPAMKTTTKVRKQNTADMKSAREAKKPNAMTGLTKAEMNKMSPLELFGMLPSLAKKVVLDPKTTGVKVGANVHKFLRQIDNVVDMLVGFEFEYNTAHYLGSGLYEIEPEKIAKVVYGNYLKKVQILSQAVSKEENKFFSGDLLKELERLDRAGKLKGYSYLEGIDKHDINELIHMHVEDREDYSFTDNWALMTPDEAEEDYGNYWMSKRSKSAVKNELEGVTRLKKRIIEDLKKLKGDIQID